MNISRNLAQVIIDAGYGWGISRCNDLGIPVGGHVAPDPPIWSRRGGTKRHRKNNRLHTSKLTKARHKRP